MYTQHMDFHGRDMRVMNNNHFPCLSNAQDPRECVKDHLRFDGSCQ